MAQPRTLSFIQTCETIMEIQTTAHEETKELKRRLTETECKLDAKRRKIAEQETQLMEIRDQMVQMFIEDAKASSNFTQLFRAEANLHKVLLQEKSSQVTELTKKVEQLERKIIRMKRERDDEKNQIRNKLASLQEFCRDDTTVSSDDDSDSDQ